MTRAQDLLATFLKGYAEVINTVELLTDEQWRLKTADEGWPVGVVAHHLAAGPDLETLEWLLSGHTTPYWADWNELDARNAQDARDFADCTKEETLDLFRDFSSRIDGIVGALTDEQLKILGVTVAGGPTTVEQYILVMMPLHIESHHLSILKTISQNSTG